MTWVFLILALVFGVAFLHPFIFYPLSLQLIGRRPIQFDDEAAPVSATLVFCAYNEERSVPEKLENLRQIRAVAPDIQFMAYVDKSTDRTLELLQAHPDLLTVIGATERTGKAVGMSLLAKAATTEIMIFTDANVTVEPESIPRLRRYFSDPDIGGVCGNLIYTNPGESATAATGSAYWRLEEFIKRGESRAGSTMGADGSLFATRRAYYPVVPAHLLDDFIVSMSIVFSKLRLVSAPDVIAYEKSAAASSDEFRRKRRIACRAYSSHRHLLPQVRKLPLGSAYKYFSHRVMRWYSGFSAALAAIFGLLFIGFGFGPVWAVAAAAALVAGYALGRYTKTPGVSHAVEAGLQIYAATLGVIDSLQGKTYQTWQPAQSR